MNEELTKQIKQATDKMLNSLISAADLHATTQEIIGESEKESFSHWKIEMRAAAQWQLHLVDECTQFELEELNALNYDKKEELLSMLRSAAKHHEENAIAFANAVGIDYNYA